MLFWGAKISISKHALSALSLFMNLRAIARSLIAKLTTIMGAKDANVDTI